MRHAVSRPTEHPTKRPTKRPQESLTTAATLSASLLTVATLSACSVLPINPFHGAFSKGASLDALTTATTHVQELKDRGANQVELLALQLENGELGSVAVTVPTAASSPRTWSQWHLDDSDGSQFSDEPLDDVLGAITTFSPTEAPIADLVAAVHKRAIEDPRCSAPDMLTHVSYRVTPSGKASVETFCAPSDDIVNRNGELTITDDVAGLSDPSSAAAGDGAVTIDRPLNLLQADDMRTLLHYAGAFFGDTLTSIEVQPPANLSDGVPGYVFRGTVAPSVGGSPECTPTMRINMSANMILSSGQGPLTDNITSQPVGLQCLPPPGRLRQSPVGDTTGVPLWSRISAATSYTVLMSPSHSTSHGAP